MKAINKQPKIRFKGFTDAWERCELKNMGTFAKGKGYVKSDLKKYGTPIILYGRMYINYSSTIEKVDTFVTPKENSIYSKGKEVIIPASGETAEEIARASFVEGKGIILGGDLNIVYPFKELLPGFLALTISNGGTQRELSKKAQGKSVVHIHNSDIKELEIAYPKLYEQKQIYSYFKSLDKSITLHQRKLKKLKKFKKVMLDKMFPKNGENIPKIRFKGFTDAWEQRELGVDIADIIGGGTPSTSNPNYWNGNINWYTPTEIGKEIYVTSSSKKITKEGLKNSSAKILPANKTILFTSRAGIGDMAILKKPGTTNQGFQSFVIKDNYYTYFIYSNGNNIKDYALKNSSGSTFLEISSKNLGTMKLFCPSFKEQEKIGKYFESLDKSITLHQRKIEKLQKVKKAMLDNMFV